MFETHDHEFLGKPYSISRFDYNARLQEVTAPPIEGVLTMLIAGQVSSDDTSNAGKCSFFGVFWAF